MRLRSLHIVRLPGIHPGFKLDDPAPGVNVVLGPNASGKTSLVRALRAVLYRDELRHEGVHVEATFEDEDSGAALGVLRIGHDLHWTLDGSRSEAPPLPERRFLSCYTLGVEDLLDQAHETDAEIGERLVRELAGGYDLRAVREQEPFRLKANHGRHEAGDLTEAEQALRKHMQSRQALQNDEDALESLRQHKHEAESARHEAELRERALDLLEKRRRRRTLEQLRQDFPHGMDRLRDDDRERLAELRKRLDDNETDRQNAVDKRTSAQAALRESGLADAAPDEGRLDDHRQTLARLRRAETQREQKRSELTRAEAALERAVDALGGTPDEPPKLDAATVHDVEQALVKKRELESARARLEEELRHLPTADAPTPDPEPLQAARRELLRWLAAPRTPQLTGLRKAAVAALLAAGAAGIVAAAAGVHWSLLALLLPFAWGIHALVLGPAAGGARRREAEQRFAESAQAPPETWSTRHVEERMAALDREVVDAERRARGIERRAEVGRELAENGATLEHVDERLRAVADRVGHDPGKLDASLPNWLQLVSSWAQARQQTAAVRAEHDEWAEQAHELRSELIRFLNHHGETPGVEEPDAETLSGRLERLADRMRRREQALHEIAQAERDIERIDEHLETARRQIRDLFERLELTPGDDDSLRARLERHEEWSKLTRELREISGLETDRRQQLGQREDVLALVDADDEETLRRQRDAQHEQASNLEKLIQEITRIEMEIERAGRERELEASRARHRHAEDSLRDRLDEALFAEAGRFLLERVEAEHEQAMQPAALRRAHEWFGRFTRHQYELVFSADGESRFAARETASDAVRRLSELSSGTRMQLLLAVRIAFALSAERGATRLPLFLDEALTTADPERFAAAAECLSVLATEDGRQVFYLTAQPEDIAYWTEGGRDAHCINLAELRGREQAIVDPAALTPRERPAVPAPAGLSAEQYAAALGVAPIDPWAAPEGIHVFFVVHDDLELLRRLLELGVDRIGPAESLLAAEAVDAVLTENQRARLRARIEGAKAWIHAWRRGRGRPVDREALERCEAVSETFIDRVAARNEALGGDGAALIQALANGDVPRFYTDKREALEAWLTENGYIDPDPRLSRSEIELRVIAAVRPWLSDGDSVTQEARVLSEKLEAGVAASSADAVSARPEAAG